MIVENNSRADAAFFNNAVREHWGMENKLHWVLDVASRKDESNKRAVDAAENFSFIHKIAINFLQNRDEQLFPKLYLTKLNTSSVLN